MSGGRAWRHFPFHPRPLRVYRCFFGALILQRVVRRCGLARGRVRQAYLGSMASRARLYRRSVAGGVELATWIGSISAVASAVAAGFSYKASKRANLSAATLSEIEATRYHREFCPEFEARLERWSLGDGGGHLRLVIEFSGPNSLQRLDQVELSVRDDRPDRGVREPATTLTLDDVRGVVWGPLRLSPGIGADASDARADSVGRSITLTTPLSVGEAIQFQMEWTKAPRWYSGDQPLHQWFRDMPGPLKLGITARSSDFADPWYIPIKIPLSQALRYLRGGWGDQQEPPRSGP